MAYLLLQNVSSQKQVLGAVTGGLSQKIGTRVSSGDVEWNFPNAFVLNDLFVEDKRGDTLLFVKRARVTVNILPLFENRVSLRTVQLSQMEANISQDEASKAFNFQFIIDAFKKKEKSESNWSADVESVSLKDCRVSFHRDSVNLSPGRFNPRFLDVDSINGILFVRQLSSDSLNIKLHKFSFKESSGVVLSDFSTLVLGNKHMAELKNFSTKMPGSEVSFAKVKASFDSLGARDVFHDYRLDVVFNPSHIKLTDLAPFVPPFAQLGEVFKVRGAISGILADLSVRDLFMQYGEDLIVDCDIRTRGLPDFKRANADIDFRQISFTPEDVRHFGSAFIGREVFLPPAVSNMGLVKFFGNVSGSLSSIFADGVLSSAPGDIDVSLSISNPDYRFASYKISGSVETGDFRLARLLPKSGLGNTGFSLSVALARNEGSDRLFDLQAEGVVDSIAFRGYNYKDISLNGNFGRGGFDGELSIDDPNARLRFSGSARNLFDVPVVKFTADADNICLGTLNITNNGVDNCLSFSMQTDFKGRTFDQLEGFFTVDNILVRRPGGRDVLINNVSVNVDPLKGGRKSATIISDYVNGSINGRYQVADLVNNIKALLSNYVPSLIPKADEKPKDNEFDFNFKLSNTEVLSDAFSLPVSMISEGTLKGFFNDRRGLFNVRLQTPLLSVGKNTLEDVLVLLENPSDEARAVVRFSTLPQNKRRNPLYVSFSSSARNDSIKSKLNFSNSNGETYSGELNLLTVLDSITNGKPNVDVFVNPTTFILKDAYWNMHQSHIKIRPGSLVVDNFLLDHEDQKISIDGLSTNNPSDFIQLTLKNIELGYISNMINSDKVFFDGVANGTVNTYTLFNGPVFTTALDVRKADLNGYPLGDLAVEGNFKTADKRILFDAGLSSHITGARSDIHGGVYLSRDSMSIGGDLKDIDLRFLRNYFGNVLSDFCGEATGYVRAFGHFGDIGLEGSPVLSKASFGIEFLNTEYFVDRDTVFMTHESFGLRNATARDKYDHKAKVNGKVTHHGFKDFVFNVNLDCKNLLALNTSEANSETFYGRAYATGLVKLTGNTNGVNFKMRVKNEDNTVITIPIGTVSDVGSVSYITFVNDEERQTALEKKRLRRERIKRVQDEKNVRSRITLDMQMDVNPSAQIQLIMDPRAGDIIKTRGSGAMHLTYDSQLSDFGIFGTYEVNRGDYLFTVQSIISRRFNILDGSIIRFTGSPYSAGLDVRAKYSLNASLQGVINDPSYNATSTNVDCLLGLTGSLQAPVIKLSLDLPNADEELKRKVASVMNTEELVNRNVASLMALGHFYTMDNASGASGRSADNEFASVGISTLSSEIGNLLSRINDDVNVGFNYNPGSEADAVSSEFEVSLSTQLLNERLKLNGNFGYRENTAPTLNQSGTSGIVDFDIEYKLVPSGRFSLKAFNRSDNSYFRQDNNGTQGVGLLYREDFDTYGQWFNRYWRPLSGLFSKRARTAPAKQSGQDSVGGKP